MDRLPTILLSLLILLFGGCRATSGVSSESFRDTIPVISFCDLNKSKGVQVYLKANYSGIDEYWSLTDPHNRNCDPKLTVDLQFSGVNPFMPPEEFEGLFRKVAENSHNSYLVLEMIGRFENGSKEGYGHLGHNNSRFIADEIIKARFLGR